MRNVLQVNVRLSEGGAAGVARTLHDNLRAEGFSSSIAYGYGASGETSPLEGTYNALRLTAKTRAAVNLVAHRLRGEELLGPTTRVRSELVKSIRAADIVHLHAIHSYMLPPRELLELISREGKPVVWTMHDQWLMTGRCAQPGTCEGWRGGCDPCPFLKAYPPASLDRAAIQFDRRRAALEKLSETVKVQIVACAEWLAEEMRSSGLGDVSTVTNSVDNEFWEVSRSVRENTDSIDEPNFLFMSRDLRDPVKVDIALLRRIGQAAPGRLTIVGNNMVEGVPGARIIPAINDRRLMVEQMKQHSHLIFSSKVDYYPLTIAEALTAGLKVLARDSAAAREFSADDGVRIVEDESSWESRIRAEQVSSFAPSARDSDKFAPERMAKQYAAIYRDLLR